MPKRLSVWIATLALPVSATAQYEQLPTLIVEGEIMRPGTVSLQPGTIGSLDAANFLKHLPGGNVNRNGPLTGIAQFRGLYAERVNLLINQMPLKAACINAMDDPASHIPSSLFRSVTIYREVTPVSTGLETLGGTILMESRQSEFTDEERFSLQGFATSGYNSVSNGYFGAGLVGVANQTLRAHFAGSVEDGRDYRFDRTRRVNPSEYRRETYELGFGVRGAGQEFGLTYDKKDIGHTGTPALPMDIIWDRMQIWRGNYQVDLGEGLKLEAMTYYQNANHAMNNFTLRPNPNRMMWREAETDLETGGGRLVLTVPAVGPGRMLAGVDVDLANHNAWVHSPTDLAFFYKNFNDVDRHRYSGFLEWQGEPLTKLQVTAGVRYRFTYMDAGKADASPAQANPKSPIAALRDRFNAAEHRQDQHDVDVALNFRYQLDEPLALVLGLARKTQAPTFQQRYLWSPSEATGGLADGRVYMGKIGLDSEKSYEAVAGFDFRLDHLGDWIHGLYFEPRGFYRYVNDYIQGQPVTDPLVLAAANAQVPNRTCPNDPSPGDNDASDCVLEWSNIDAQLYGTDIQAGVALGEHFRLDGIMNYTRGQKLSGKNDNLYRIAPLNGRLRGTVSWWDFAFSAEIVGALRQDKVAEYNKERRTSDWSVVNLRLQYQPSYKYVEGLKLAFGVDNLFDNEHRDHLNGLNRVSGVRDLPVGSRLPNPGRNLYVTLVYDF
jgi:iron complex outermembrane receptor protein